MTATQCYTIQKDVTKVQYHYHLWRPTVCQYASKINHLHSLSSWFIILYHIHHVFMCLRMLQGFPESRTDTLRISPGGMTRLGHLLTHLRGFCEPHVFSAVKLVRQAFLTFPWHNCKAIGWKCNTSRRSRPTCTCTARHKISDQTAILNHLSQTRHLLPHKCAFQVSSTLIGGFNPSSKSSIIGIYWNHHSRKDGPWQPFGMSQHGRFFRSPRFKACSKSLLLHGSSRQASGKNRMCEGILPIRWLDHTRSNTAHSNAETRFLGEFLA
jgi:hypothetical protein